MFLTDIQGDIVTRVRAQFGSAPPARLGVAVSGGGDSVALLHILAGCFDPGSVHLYAVTVDHGLRKEAADEACQVAVLAESLGISHTTLHWSGWDGRGNLQGEARQARYKLMSDWARTQEIAVFALGHTADDQAETVLMGLARRSGVNGLSAMPVRRIQDGISLIRPLLGITRAELRTYLEEHDIAWTDDPSNDDLRFDRVKMREALKVLAPLGLTAQSLSEVATNMSQAREALDWFSFLSARDLASVDGGDVVLDLRQFRTLPEEIARRLLVRSIGWVCGDVRGPRRAAVTEALDAVRAGRSFTLSGCQLLRHNRKIWVCREYNAVRDMRCAVGMHWDQRWCVTGTAEPDLEIRPLGRAGLSKCSDWRLTGRPLASLIASPSVWSGSDLVAAPLAGMSGSWEMRLSGGEEEFFASLLSH